MAELPRCAGDRLDDSSLCVHFADRAGKTVRDVEIVLVVDGQSRRAGKPRGGRWATVTFRERRSGGQGLPGNDGHVGRRVYLENNSEVARCNVDVSVRVLRQVIKVTESTL